MSGPSLIQYTDQLNITQKEGKTYIYDPIRKKKLILMAEELVRQCIILFLMKEKNVSRNLIKVETGITVNKLTRRCDIIVCTKNGMPLLLVECKSPKVKLDQKVFNQIAMYNLPLKVPYLMVSNGTKTYYCKIDFEKEDFKFFDVLPDYEILLENVKLGKK